MKTTIKIRLPKDFQLMCMLMSCEPAGVIQYYLNGISLPWQMSVHPEDPEGMRTGFFLKNTGTCDTEETQDLIDAINDENFHERLCLIAQMDIEQPECEQLLRQEISKWRDKCLSIRKDLKGNEPNYTIVEYEH